VFRLGARSCAGCPHDQPTAMHTHRHACLGLDASIQRATVLLAMSSSWDTVGYQKDLYDSILKEEGITRRD
jgi:hypothetical protein